MKSKTLTKRSCKQPSTTMASLTCYNHSMTFWISRESTVSHHANLLYIHYKYNKYHPTTGWNFMIRCESPSLTIHLHVQWMGPLLPSQKRSRAGTWKIVPNSIKIIFQFQRKKWTELTAGTWKSSFYEWKGNGYIILDNLITYIIWTQNYFQFKPVRFVFKARSLGAALRWLGQDGGTWSCLVGEPKR